MRILFVTPGLMGSRVGTGKLASFQEADLELLRQLGHEVRPFLWYGRPIGRLWQGARWADLVFCWSISDHALIASLFGRRLACVVGGYEFANIPECNYGNMLTARMRWITRRVWKKADALLYVDPSLEDEATRAFGHPGRAFYVPTGYDTEFWTLSGNLRENIAVTVCHAPSVERLKLKGVDLFLELASTNPDVTFHVVGEVPRELSKATLGPNVVMDGWLEREGLRELYRRAKVYCQFSLHEGLPNAVCEAMLCGCVPIGTKVNGIPNAIGDAGFLVPREPAVIDRTLRMALTEDSLGLRARDRISRLFPIERRRTLLKEVLDSLVI